MHLDPDADASTRLITFDTLGSTNAEALARARAGEQGPLWIVAERQTAGRGRRGNVWTSEPGNLYASLLLTEALPAAHLPELCFVVALGALDAIAEVAPHFGSRLKLKWPNDLLLDGVKFAGILIEGETVRDRSVVVAGIGINCAHHPSGLPYPVTDLAASGAAVTPADLMRALARAMRARLAQWDRGSGFATIRAEWLNHAAGIGGDIRVRLADRELTGKFETLDRMGRLMLRLPAGNLEAITVGEVFAPNILTHPPLEGEGRREAPGSGPSSDLTTPTRRAPPVDLPLSGGGERPE